MLSSNTAVMNSTVSFQLKSDPNCNLNLAVKQQMKNKIKTCPAPPYLAMPSPLIQLLKRKKWRSELLGKKQKPRENCSRSEKKGKG